MIELLNENICNLKEDYRVSKLDQDLLKKQIKTIKNDDRASLEKELTALKQQVNHNSFIIREM